ncbi:universal stress protein [Scytonema hofmannii PCC 7110]|uniref:Universal stress protein n=1 Tax=Scytonema hofmannii PCC 7110 TaxID=128403 RepID=A0A139X8M3_9CYAN|nr:universal stress protein [Scytonema hofmannii]KYC41048.1 universal stress protein [Scytonema hofmannii PCC 7110]
MFHKILVALDTSTSGKSVFEEALALAKALGANLTLLHVLSQQEEGSPDISLLSSPEYYVGLGMSTEILKYSAAQWEEFVNRGLEMLRSLADKATAAGVSCELTQKLGSPGRTICEFASHGGFDLIVIGRRGRSGLSELFLGSVSNYVLHHASCSVLTVRHPVTASKSEAAQAEVAPSI